MSPAAGARRYGVLGYPVEHSLSPAIHGAAFREAGIDARYERFAVPPDRLPGWVAEVRAGSVDGWNVTAPHKEAILPLLDRVGDTARAVRAVNTVTRDGDDLVGENTDVEGFAAFLSDAGFDPAGARVLILGAGGAARACAHALGDGPASIAFAARSPDRLGSPRRGWTVVGWGEDGRSADLLVNATPLGWQGEETPLRPHAGQVVVDLVYRRTPLLEAAEAAGAVAHDGVGLLVRQAALSFTIWTGSPAPIAAMHDAARAALG